MSANPFCDLPMWTIYENPRDYPRKYVVRRWVIIRGNPQPQPDQRPIAVVDTLEEARAAVPIGATLIPRDPGDDHTIVETWI